MATVYYVEDDENIRELTLYALRHSDLEARGFSSVAGFFEACSEQRPDIILLDIMLPDTDGLQILDRIRHDEGLQDIPVMMLTAKDTELDIVTALDRGADDHLAKPFGMMELVSRVKALLRRAQRPTLGEQRPSIAHGDILIDEGAHQASIGGMPLDLTLKEFELLRVLMRHAGNVLTRAQLFEAVWGSAFLGTTRTVDVHMQTLRQKMEAAQPGASAAIQTVRGVGYRFGDARSHA